MQSKLGRVRLFALLASLIMLASFLPFIGEQAYAEDETPEVISDTNMNNMIWSWFTGPQVISEGDQLFWSFTTDLDEDNKRYVGVASYNKQTGTTTKKILGEVYVGTDDQGDNYGVALGLSSDKQLICAYPTNGTARKMITVQVSDSPLDINSFTTTYSQKPSDHTFTNCQIVESNKKLYLFFRLNGKGSWSYITSADGGATWSAATIFVLNSGSQYYCKFTPTTDDNMIRVAMYPGTTTTADIRMGFLNTSDGYAYNADASTKLSASRNDPSSFTVVQEASTGKTQRLLDVAVTSPSNSRFVFATFTNTAETKDCEYKLYNAGNVTKICDAGDALLDPSIQLGASFRGANDIIVARNENGTDYIESYSLADNTLTKQDTLYSLEVTGNSRAARPIVDVNGKAFLWHEGSYSSATSFNTSAKLMYFTKAMTAPEIVLSSTEFYYNGEVQKPTVTCGTLVEGTDYDLTWSNSDSTEAGDYSVTATFKGNYAGEKTANYTILPDPLSLDKDAYVTGESINVTSTYYASGSWVGLYKADEPVDGSKLSIYWAYVPSDMSTFNILDGDGTNGRLDEFVTGAYKIVLYKDGGYTPIATEFFNYTVPPSTFSIEKNSFCKDEAIKISATSLSSGAWVGLYPYDGGDPLDNGDLLSHYNLSDVTGTDPVDILHDDIVLDKDKVVNLATGRYKIILFTDGWSIDTTMGHLAIESFYITDHTLGEPEYEWAEDYSTVKATQKCDLCGKVTATETVSASLQSTTPATCTTAGAKIYTSEAFNNEAFTVQSKEDPIAIDPDAHGYGDWQFDADTHKHSRTCSYNSEHVDVQDCTFDNGVESGGVVTYTCSVCGGTYTEPLSEETSLKLYDSATATEQAETFNHTRGTSWGDSSNPAFYVEAVCKKEGAWVGIYQGTRSTSYDFSNNGSLIYKNLDSSINDGQRFNIIEKYDGCNSDQNNYWIFPTGEYTLALFGDSGYTVEKVVHFSIVNNVDGYSITLNSEEDDFTTNFYGTTFNSTFTKGKGINFTINNANDSGAWLAIVQADEGLNGNYVGWTDAPETGTHTFADDNTVWKGQKVEGEYPPTDIPAGYYKVVLFDNWSYAEAIEYVYIRPDASGATVTLSYDEFTYNGKLQQPEISSVTQGSTTYQPGHYNATIPESIDAGEYTVNVAFHGTYGGSASAAYTIVKANTANLTIEDIPDQKYTGSAIEPEVIVKDSNGNVIPSTDYSVAYSNNTMYADSTDDNAPTVTVTAIPDGNLTGDPISKTFSITQPHVHDWDYEHAVIIKAPTEDEDGELEVPCSGCSEKQIVKLDKITYASILIDRLPSTEELTLDDEEAVAEARAAYDMLTEDQQAQFKDIIEAAEAKIAELKGGDNPDKEIEEAIEAAKAVLKDAKEIETADGKYTADSFKALTDAIDALQKEIDKEDATAESIKAATQAVKDAVAGLVETETPSGDDEAKEQAKAAANEVLKSADEIKNDDSKYTAESYKALTDAVDALKAELAKEDATAQSIKDATKAVTDAIAGLQEASSGGDDQPDEAKEQAKAAADEALKAADEIKNDDGKYTADSYKALTDAVDALKAELAKEDATAESIQAATQAVKDAIGGLKEAETPSDEAKEQAKTAANEALNAAKNLKNNDGKYTADSYKALTDAVDALNAELANPNATAESIQKATQAVKDAIEGLIEAAVPVDDQPLVELGKTYKVSGQSYKVTLVADAADGTVTFVKAKNAKKVTVPATIKLADGKTYKVNAVGAKAFKGKKIKTVTIGKNVKKLAKGALSKSKATKLIVKTKLLKKASVKGSLKGSKIKKVQVKVGSKKVNKKFVKKYKKIFTKKIAGKKVSVK